MLGNRMGGWWRSMSRVASLAGCLALGMAGCHSISRRGAAPAFSYEILVIGEYRRPLPEEFAGLIAGLEPGEVMVATLGADSLPKAIGVTADPELHRRIAEAQLRDCSGLHSREDPMAQMCYLVVRTGERNFKEVRLLMPDVLRSNPLETAALP